ncbi:CYTH domain-containing protein, partial [Bradyrhizobium manausense]|uniref:CYTH domain-containing protein n=1 Tax=Bradyrhizobium manausense TaxID=989370 RepID=UPI001FD8C490
MNAETELKFRVAPRKLASVLRGGRRSDRSEKTLVSTYYDTSKHKLRRHGLTLRVRKIEDHFIQTVKAGGAGGVTRGEWEQDVAGEKPDLEKSRDTPLDRLASKKLSRKLRPVFQTIVHRVAQARRVRNSRIELAVDRGRIGARRRAQPIAELELELKSGRVGDLFQMARTIARKTGAELDLRSKAERGYRLATGVRDGAQH